MQRSIIAKHVLPFFQWFGLMVFLALAIDYGLHRADMLILGRYLGYVGTVIIIASFIYSLRKRKIIETGSPKVLLQIHEYMSWGGSILVLVHAGIHFNALLPWLAVLMLLIAVASGLIGKFVLKKATEDLKLKKKDLVTQGKTAEQADQQLYFDSLAVDAMKQWRVVHLPITLVFAILALAHIVTVIMFWK